jgi:2-C-methyl-D-erythritol 2,4-cyclodiphosphate synthase
VSFRIGIGFDLHRLEPNTPLVIGGVLIPHTLGLIGHSDGDVLCHAITDALLGAAGIGNIGELFPDTDPALKGMSSLRFLEKSIVLVRAKGFEVGNIDSNILAERPKLLSYFPAMASKMAAALGVTPDKIQVKAKTMEGLGIVGTELAIAAEAIALLVGGEQK